MGEVALAKATLSITTPTLLSELLEKDEVPIPRMAMEPAGPLVAFKEGADRVRSATSVMFWRRSWSPPTTVTA